MRRRNFEGTAGHAVSRLKSYARPFAAETGFTLAEVNVSLFLALLTVGLLFPAYLLGVRSFEERRQAMVIENDLHLILHRLSTDLIYAGQIIREPDGAWMLTYASGDTHVYRYAAGALARDGVPMHDPRVTVDSFALRPSSPATIYAFTGEGVDGEVALGVAVEIVLELSGRRDSLSTASTGAIRSSLSARTMVSLRHDRPWERLPLFLPPSE